MRKSKRALSNTILTGAEARGEAAYAVLKIVLERVATSELKRIQAEAYIYAHNLGIELVREEIECLFPDAGL